MRDCHVRQPAVVTKKLFFRQRKKLTEARPHSHWHSTSARRVARCRTVIVTREAHACWWGWLVSILLLLGDEYVRRSLVGPNTERRRLAEASIHGNMGGGIAQPRGANPLSNSDVLGTTQRIPTPAHGFCVQMVEGSPPTRIMIPKKGYQR